ncbi:MAG: acetolactate synthase small subunit [Actinobacteria bacterium]|nr:acetolactate synthase small subunit [Actinomycetota bacterium]
MKHTLSVLVENKPGVLARVAGLFRRRGFNIHSLAVAPTENPNLSRMTIVVDLEGKPLEQVEKQLHKLVNVLKIQDFLPHEAVERELALIKVHSTKETRAEIIQICDIFRAKIVDVSQDSLAIEVTGTEDKIDAIVSLLKPYRIIDLARTGKVAVSRGRK